MCVAQFPYSGGIPGDDQKTVAPCAKGFPMSSDDVTGTQPDYPIRTNDPMAVDPPLPEPTESPPPWAALLAQLADLNERCEAEGHSIVSVIEAAARQILGILR
jgi:hypothetical protein